MKICPVCKETSFDDAEVCYGCLCPFPGDLSQQNDQAVLLNPVSTGEQKVLPMRLLSADTLPDPAKAPSGASASAPSFASSPTFASTSVSAPTSVSTPAFGPASTSASAPTGASAFAPAAPIRLTGGSAALKSDGAGQLGGGVAACAEGLPVSFSWGHAGASSMQKATSSQGQWKICLEISLSGLPGEASLQEGVAEEEAAYLLDVE